MLTCTGCDFQASAGFAFTCEADFAFCPRCGSVQPAGAGGAIPAATPSIAVNPERTPAPMKPDSISRGGDRRQVTVLFADLSGFTALSERLDPEEMRAFQNALFEMLARAITRYDGFVEKFVGDAALAVSQEVCERAGVEPDALRVLPFLC